MKFIAGKTRSHWRWVLRFTDQALGVSTPPLNFAAQNYLGSRTHLLCGKRRAVGPDNAATSTRECSSSGYGEQGRVGLCRVSGKKPQYFWSGLGKTTWNNN